MRRNEPIPTHPRTGRRGDCSSERDCVNWLVLRSLHRGGTLSPLDWFGQAMRLRILRSFRARETSAMRVDRNDGTCRSCDGTLTIIDADDATMTVECDDCQDVYKVEPDAFGDGCMTYYVGFHTGELTNREEN